MTGPVAPYLNQPIDQLGEILNAYQTERQHYDNTRTQYLSSGGPGPVQQAASALQAHTDPQQWRDEDLVAAGVYWGVPEEVARHMPHDQLEMLVNDYRSKARPEDFATQFMTASWALPAMFGVGAGEAVTGGVQRLPLVGEWLQKQQWMHQADSYMRQLEEGVRSSTPEWEQKMLSVYNVGGNIAAMWYPAQAVWAVTGITGIGAAGAGLGTRLAMGAVRGGLSSYLLDGGSQDFKDHPMFSLGLGAALGAAGGFLPADQIAKQAKTIGQATEDLSTRVTGKFMPPPEAVGGVGTSVPIGAEEALQQAAAAGDQTAQQMLEYLTSQRQSRGMNAQQAEAFSVQLNKAATVVQSPAFLDIAGQADIAEADVVRAAAASNPGGINIVQGVSDPVAVANASVDPIAFARRGDRLDAIFVPPDRSAAQIVAQYEQFGLFGGQAVRDVHGVEGTIDHIQPSGTVLFQPKGGGPLAAYPIEHIQPQLGTPGIIEVPGMWTDFSRYADQRAMESAGAMGGMEPELVHQMRAMNLIQYANQFLDEQQIVNPGDRQRILNYFDQRYVQSLKDLVPDVVAQAEAIAQDAPLISLPQGSLDELDNAANIKGFIAIPDGPGVTLRDVSDQAAPAQIRFNSIEAASTWVRNLNRELPDITPATDVPLDVAGRLPLDPTQAPNLNHAHIPGMMAEMEALAGEGGVPIGPELLTAAASGDVGAVRRQWMTRSMDFMPRRRLFSYIDEMMHKEGLGIGIAADYDAHGSAAIVADNIATEFQNDLRDLTNKIRPENARSGTWARFLSLDPTSRATEAAAAGLNPSEISAFDDWDALVHKMHPDASDAEVQEVAKYFNHIGQRQSDTATIDAAFEEYPALTQQGDLLSGQSTSASTIQDFYNYARGGHLDFRSLDPRIVGDQYIRANMWTRGGASASYDELMGKYKQLAQVPEFGDVAQMMTDWLKQTRYGYNPADDIAFSAVGGVMEKLMGQGWTDTHTKELFRMGISSIYSGMLGFRPAMMSRDALRLFFALPKVGPELLTTMGKWATSSDFREASFAAAVREGGVSVRPAELAAPGAFAASSEAINAGSAGLGEAPEMSDRMRFALGVRDAIVSHLPNWAKPSSDEITHPLYLLTKQLQAMRAIVYTAAKQRTATALRAFNDGGRTDFGALLGESGMRTLDPSWRRQFQQIVASGNDHAAAIFAGRQMADATMFKYGASEAPIVARTLTGRVAMQMGHFAQQVVQYLREGVTNGTVMDRVKFGVTAGGVTYALNKATEKYGWNFKWMNPYYGLGFAGGPLLELGGGALDFIRGTASALKGEDVGTSPITQGWHEITDIGEHMNPLYGLYRTAQGVGQGLTQSPYPGQAVARHFITGEIGPGPDITEQQMPQAQAFFRQSLQMQQNPVSVTRQGLLPGMIPPQFQSAPPLLQLGNPLPHDQLQHSPQVGQNDPTQPTPYQPGGGGEQPPYNDFMGGAQQ